MGLAFGCTKDHSDDRLFHHEARKNTMDQFFSEGFSYLPEKKKEKEEQKEPQSSEEPPPPDPSASGRRDSIEINPGEIEQSLINSNINTFGANSRKLRSNSESSIINTFGSKFKRNRYDIIHDIADIQAVHKVFIMSYANQMAKVNASKMNKKSTFKHKQPLKPEMIKITDSEPTPWGLQEYNDHFLSPSISQSNTTSIIYKEDIDENKDEKEEKQQEQDPDVDDIEVDIEDDQKERELDVMIAEKSLSRSVQQEPGGVYENDRNDGNDHSMMVQSPMTEKSDSDEMMNTLSIFNIRFWDQHDIESFLISIGSGGYVQTFKENEISGDCMQEMTERGLKSMDVPLAHCENILAKRDWYKLWFVSPFYIFIFILK